MAEIINGKVVSASVREEIAREVALFREEHGVAPGLAVIIVGEDPASQVYVRNKHKGCTEVGMYSLQIPMPAETTEEELLEKIGELNADDSIHGILVQLPLPKHINEDRVINSILPEKDVDAFHPTNVGKIMLGKYDLLPCTPAGIMELLSFYNVDIRGKECVVLGRSNIVGKPMSQLLLAKDGTVTVCHSKTVDLASVTRRADILVVAIGRAGFVTADMIKPGAVVIDVGINRLDNGKLMGDVDYDGVLDKVSMITPVPGGVGPMTITMLLKNTLTAAKKKFSDK
ncbi:MAG: bifunctional methylenetetrahydrofolate dehydrogenase/methenyltetrahydrofolate cyclohydrolase FolD [Clostridia bacterium]|nr:bifunctional methylenetetrahydrofolate dehydrogenase/methenyltetrahydrofolate cyclohydrolase FolD [Clostridia bacterium]